MKVEQLTVKLPRNEPGNLARITGILAEEGINILALSIAEAEAGGVLRMIVNDAAHACDVLRDQGFATGIELVVVVAAPDKPGGLAQVLNFIAREGFNIEYLYAFSHRSGEAGVNIFSFEHADEAITRLNKEGFRILTIEEVLAL